MLQLHFSNRPEALTRLLLGNLAATAGDVFAPAGIIVPSRAVERSVTLAMADSRGICANVQFDFLARWLWCQIARVVPGVAATSPFEPGPLAWRIWGILGDPAYVASHPRLASYLQDGDALLRYELACRLAALIRDYSTYRDEWLEAWARGGRVTELAPQSRADEAWQADLYRRIVTAQHVSAVHPGTAFIAALAQMDALAARAAGLPAHLHLFALPTLPPQHLRLLAALAPLVDIHVYVLNPCEEYWFEVVDRRRLRYLAARGRDQYQEEGNRLLAGWGRQAQSHIGLLVDLDGTALVDDCQFEPAATDTLLAQLQDSILRLTAVAPATLHFTAGDRSLEVHDCHSLGRELEVLHDTLLDLFRDAAGALRPCDILVAVPDLEAAAPLIEAVFGTVPADRAIPYQLTGRARSTVNAPARTLLALLALVASRCTAPAVFDLLQQPCVARRFGLDDAGLQQVREWMEESGMRWALDAAHASATGAPPQSRHTLADGLERLFLGFALPEGAAGPGIGGLLPAANAAGAGALALGVLYGFIARLAELQRRVAVAQSPDAWRQCLVATVNDFIAADAADIDDLDELRLRIDGLAAAMGQGGVDGDVSLAVVQAALAALLEDEALGGVPTGRVTFASLSSLRGIPFEVVCVLGLDDGVFPTTTRAAEFDLLAQHPRRGDRQRATDERNLFLDLVLAARRRLYLSYSGRGVRDNAPLPPSVLVAELLDTVGRDIAERIVVAHPLQPFSRECFASDADPRLQSFDADLGAAVQEAGAGTPALPSARVPVAAEDEDGDDDDEASAARVAARAQPPFFTAPLAPPAAAWRDVSLTQLTEFFANPSRYLLRRRLGLQLHRDEEELADAEPFALARRDERALAARLLPQLLRDPADPAAAMLLAGGIETPGGSVGEYVRAQALHDLRSFATRVSPLLRESCLPPHEAVIDCEVAGESWRITAVLQDLRAAGLVRWSYDRPPDFAPLRAAAALRVWLEHLTLCASAPPSVSRATQAIGRAAAWRFTAPAEPRALLAGLLALYREGLSAPLPFLPDSAWAYVWADGDLDAARKAWRVTKFHPWGESADAAHRLAFRGLPEPLDERFASLATQVFGPLRAHLAAES